MNKLMLPKGSILADALEFMSLGETMIVHHNQSVWLCYKESHTVLRQWQSSATVVRGDV